MEAYQMKVLVFGSTGFLGNAVCSELLDKNIPYVAHVRSGHGNVRAGDTLSWDIMTPFDSQTSLVPYFDDITHIVNCAGETSFFKKNTNYQLNSKFPMLLAETYTDIPILNVGTAWTNLYPNQINNEYLKCKNVSEDYLLEWCDNVVMIRPSIITSHDELGYIATDQFFGIGQYLAYSGAFKEMENLQWDLVSVDWCARVIVDMLQRPMLKYRQYNFSAGKEFSPTLKALFDCYKDVQFVGSFNEREQRKINMAVEMYRPFIELEATFDNTRLSEEQFELPTSVVANNKMYVDRLDPKTIAWYCN